MIERGRPKALREMLHQEGRAMAFAGGPECTLDPDEAAYTRQVIAEHLGATDRPTQLACLYGDEAAREVGYEPLGLSAWAGIAVAPLFGVADDQHNA